MSIVPSPRFSKLNWFNTHKSYCNNIKSLNYSTLLIGDSIIAGLSRYKNVWKKYFEPLHSINCGIGGDKVENVLWRCNNLPPSPSLLNAVIMCGTNNINVDPVEDIVDGIIDIALSLKKKYEHINVTVCGLLPRDESWSVNRLNIKEINNYLCYKCNSIDVKFIDQCNWILQNGSLNPSFYFSDKLHLIEEGNTKLAKLIFDSINPKKNKGTSVSMSTTLFRSNKDFNLNEEDFPPLSRSIVNIPSKHVNAKYVRSCIQLVRPVILLLVVNLYVNIGKIFLLTARAILFY